MRGDQRKGKRTEKGIKEADAREMEGRGGTERGNSATQRDRERLSRSLNKQQRPGPKGIG